MELSEREIENYIWDDLIDNDGIKLQEKGLDLPCILAGRKASWHRQFNIEPYGIIDIVGFYRSGYGCISVDLIELKKVAVHPDHFEQILRYKKGLEVYLRNTFPTAYIQINCIVIGTSYTGLYLQNFLRGFSVASIKFDLDGITFDYHCASEWHMPGGKGKSFRKPQHNGQKIH